MDPVQELIDGVGQAQVDGSSSASGAPSTTTTTAASTRRTKMVFVYSDEDEAEGDGEVAAARGVAEVVCEADAIAVTEDALSEMRADAHAMDAPPHDDNNMDEPNLGGHFFFQEDVLSGLGAAATAPGLAEALLHGQSHRSGAVGGVRVKEVAAPSLWEGALAAQTGGDGEGAAAADEMPALLRRGLPAATFVLASRRKRFRDTEGEPASTNVEAPSSAATTAAAAAAAVTSTPSAGEPQSRVVSVGEAEPSVDAEEGEEEEDFDIRPVYEADGKTVCALQTRGGYQLTLDERDLLETNDEEEEGGEVEGEAVAEDGDAAVSVTEAEDGEAESGEPAAAVQSGEEAVEEWADLLDGDYDDDDDDDEEEEELDEAIVVAVVEQLVRCCEADDVDSQLSVEVGRFTAAAKPLLKELTEGTVTPKEFGQRIDRDLRRFQRIYRSVYRPRDAPIVIDGVTMDM